MKRQLPAALLTCLVFGLCSCKKNTSFTAGDAGQFAGALTTQANDEVRISSELDAVFNDIDNVLAGQAPCSTQLTVDTTDNPNHIVIAYGGNSCDGIRSRSGAITIYSAPHSSWSTAGDAVTAYFSNYTVTRIDSGKTVHLTNKTVRLNGGFNYVNLSGGNLSGLSAEGAAPIVHTILGSDIVVTFDDGSSATWQVTRQRTYTSNGGLVITTQGLDSAGGIANAAEWGGNRFGNSFVASVLTPLVISQGCNWQLSGGKLQLTNPSGTTTVTYGLTGAGTAATGCPAADSTYYMQLSWTGTGENPYNALLPYSY